MNHPLNKPVETAMLVSLENETNTVVTTFLMTRSDLMSRLGFLDVLWTVLGADRAAIMKEYVAIDGQWPYAPPEPRVDYATSVEWVVNTTDYVEANVSVTYIPDNTTEYYYIVAVNNSTQSNSTGVAEENETFCWVVTSINGVPCNSSWWKIEAIERPPSPWWWDPWDYVVPGFPQYGVRCIHIHLDKYVAPNIGPTLSIIALAFGQFFGLGIGSLLGYVGAVYQTMYYTDKNADGSFDRWDPRTRAGGTGGYVATRRYWWIPALFCWKVKAR